MSDDLYEQAKALMQGAPSPDQKSSAVILLNQSAELGNPEALRVLGLLTLQEGKDHQALAIALLERSAVNSVRAMRQLGILYANLSKPRLNDPQKAFEYLRKASDIGDGEASFYLSKLMSRAGRTNEAQRFAGLAKEQGFDGKHSRASEAKQPDSKPSDDSQVLRGYTLQRQAQKGDVESMYQYGLMLKAHQAQGSLMGYDDAPELEAFYWLKSAALMGDRRASTELESMGAIETSLAGRRLSFDKLKRMLSSR